MEENPKPAQQKKNEDKNVIPYYTSVVVVVYKF